MSPVIIVKVVCLLLTYLKLKASLLVLKEALVDLILLWGNFILKHVVAKKIKG